MTKQGMQKIEEITREKIDIRGLLVKLAGSFIGGLNDEVSTVSLIKYRSGFNVGVEHPSVNFGNEGEIYLFPNPVSEELARIRYNKFKKLLN